MSAILTTPRASSPWTLTGALLAVFVAAILFLYRDTAAVMVEIWSRTGTFAHCFLVPPISAWLLWLRRADIAAQSPVPVPWLLLPMALAGLLWLLGDLAAVNSVSQLMMVTLIVLLVPAFAGWRATHAMLFPLGFLFFAVPIGEFAIPWMMVGTADFTVLALQLTGIPVYREGFQFIIPSGNWSVVQACSGVRYLMASLMVGTLFAYLNYRSMRRRWMFMGVALIVPIVANWLRAYFIVLIGHYSDNTLATGVDHLVYGWVFFGVVMMLMFVIGARWSEPDAAPVVASSDAAPAAARMHWAMPVGTALVLALPVLALQALLAHEPHTPPRLHEPVPSEARWMAATDAAPWTPSFEKPSDRLQRSYAAVGDSATSPVGLYVGYYRQQDADSKLVGSSNRLVFPGDKDWTVDHVGARRVVPDAGVALDIKTTHLRRPLSRNDPARMVVWQVYWVNGSYTTSDFLAKVYGALYRLLGRGDDAAVLIFYADDAPAGSAEPLLERFIHDNLGSIETQLKATRDGR